MQLKPDVEPLEGPPGPAADFTDLHAWAEVFLPGAGWVGLDPTSGLLAGEGHLPLACAADPWSAAPITGTVSPCEVQFNYTLSVTRIHEDPRVTKPYTESQWQTILAVGWQVDDQLHRGDVRLTMGGEPTFVSLADMASAEWQTAALGPTKRRLAARLLRRLQARWAPGGLLHFGQGKWYPGESQPRWAFRCLWRTDGEPIWQNPELLADVDREDHHTIDDAQRVAACLALRLGIDPSHLLLAYEDVAYHLWLEQRLPIDVDAQRRTWTIRSVPNWRACCSAG